MTRIESTYSPGSWFALSCETAWMLVDLPLASDRLDAAWRALRGDAGVDSALEVLLAEGLSAVPSFAVVSIGQDGTRIVVRRPCTVKFDGETIAARGNTWTDEFRPYPESLVRLRVEDGGPSSPVRLPMSLGISQAGSISLAVVGADSEQALGRPREAGADMATVPTAFKGEVELEPVLDDELQQESRAEPARGTEEARQNNAGEEDSDKVDYSEFFAGTRRRNAFLARLSEPPTAEPEGSSAETAEDTSTSGELEKESTPTAVWREFADSMPEPHTESEPVQASTRPPSSGNLIDGLPWATGAKPAVPPVSSLSPPPSRWSSRPPTPAQGSVSRTPQPPKSVDDELEIRTMMRSKLQVDIGGTGTVGPTVLAVQCPAGHMTAPDAAACRSCGRALAPSAPREIPRPTLGLITLPSGETVKLDRDVVLGRSPQTQQQGAADKPHEIKLDDPGVSRSHLMITLDGWDVLARDLGSSNGTELALPGGDPQPLTPGQDYLMEPGSKVILADVMTITFTVPS